ncbi:MAG: ABC transporter permease [Verrucomicrobia bacterium]|nr:ABC transporter permease [Verrucomicrobiota bacterium]MBV8485903.1 ABC transporter permease [Verrucomicrobiota bacterium]
MESTETANRNIYRSQGMYLLGFLTKYYIQSLLLVSVVILAAVNPYFRTIGNLENILLQASFAGIGAAGMTLLIVSGAFDLSVAGLLGLCGVLISELLPTLGPFLTFLAAILLGVVLGSLNGVVVTKLRIPAFIATLGMMNIYLALAFIWTGGSRVIAISDPGFNSLGTGALFGILPIPFLMMIVTYLVCYGILNRSVFGRCLRAVGSSEVAGRTAGLPVDLIRILAFAIVGGCTALAGVFLSAELSSASAIMATGYELTVIAVVVIGGTSLRGGDGTLFGSFTGALFFAVISSALNILNVGAYWQYVVTGTFLISALGVQALRSYILVE